MLDWKEAPAPDTGVIEELARKAIAGLPPEFAGPAAQVVLRIEDFASDEFLDELEIDDPLELTGLYDGVPMTSALTPCNSLGKGRCQTSFIIGPKPAL